MRRTTIPYLVVTLFLLGSTPLVGEAQESRLAAFTLQCFVPTTRDYHTRATLIGTFTLQNRTIWTVASCADGPSTSPWPDFDASDGAVETVELIVVTVLEDRSISWWPTTTARPMGRMGFSRSAVWPMPSTVGRSTYWYQLPREAGAQASGCPSVIACASVLGGVGQHAGPGSTGAGPACQGGSAACLTGVGRSSQPETRSGQCPPGNPSHRCDKEW
jgi:hypothetical protein